MTSIKQLPLKYATTIITRGNAPDYVDDGPIRVIGQSANKEAGIDWSASRFHAHNGQAHLLKGYLEPFDVLVNSTGTGTLGRVGYFTGGPDTRPCIADGHITIVRADTKVLNPRYLYYQLSSRRFYDFVYAALVVGATNQIELNREKLASARVDQPPLDDQRRIADFLDAETARIDELVELQAQVRDRMYEREASYLEGLLVADHKSWKPLAALTDARRPIMYGIVLPGPDVPDGVPIVKGGDIAGGRLRVERLCRAAREIESRYVRSRLVGGDLVIAIRGSVGEVAAVPEALRGANLTQDAARISVAKGIDRHWLELVLRTPSVKGQLDARITGATVRGINIWDLKRVLVPTPATPEQVLLAHRAARTIDRHRELRARIDAQLDLLAARRQALITAAVTGQFDVTTARGVDV